jgi:hypothetical protein
MVRSFADSDRVIGSECYFRVGICATSFGAGQTDASGARDCRHRLSTVDRFDRDFVVLAGFGGQASGR